MKKAFFPCLASLLLAGRAAAQLPVDQESHHKVVFENNSIRVLEGRVPPGDTTPAHVHAANGVVVFLSQSVFSIELVGGKPVASSVRPGDLKYVNYGDKPVNHRVWVDSGGVLHFFVVELKQRQTHSDGCGVLEQAGVKFLWRQPGIVAYQVEPGIAGSIRIPKSGCGYLVVDTDGRFRFFEGKDGIHIGTDSKFLLLSVL
jgi:hypothetical protein